MAYLDEWKTKYPEKFAHEDVIFSHIRRGHHIFVTSGCGEPQYLIGAMTKYVESHPKAFFDTEIIQIYSLGIAPYTDAKFKSNFRHNSFFIGNNTRDPVNKGAADYTPISLSDIPALINSGIVPIDIALIQTSLPDEHGFLSLGVSVDMVKAATDKASLVIAQVNSNMPRVHGDGFIHIKEVNFIVPHEAPLLEIKRAFSEETTLSLQRIGNYVSRLVQDGDTLQVGYGSIQNF
jgi:acyl-CoA hydrolase